MNPTVNIKGVEVLSEMRFPLKNYTFEIKKQDGRVETQHREIYEHGDAVAVLLYNKARKTVLLTRQFRLASFLKGIESGNLIETCAGMFDGDTPEAAALKEVKEETGFELSSVQKAFEAFTSPGAFTEKIHFFVAEYADENKVGEGGGLAEEGEEVEVLEMDFDQAYSLIVSGGVQDAKTIMLLQYAKINGLL